MDTHISSLSAEDVWEILRSHGSKSNGARTQVALRELTKMYSLEAIAGAVYRFRDLESVEEADRAFCDSLGTKFKKMKVANQLEFLTEEASRLEGKWDPSRFLIFLTFLSWLPLPPESPVRSLTGSALLADSSMVYARFLSPKERAHYESKRPRRIFGILQCFKYAVAMECDRVTLTRS